MLSYLLVCSPPVLAGPGLQLLLHPPPLPLSSSLLPGLLSILFSHWTATDDGVPTHLNRSYIILGTWLHSQNLRVRSSVRTQSKIARRKRKTLEKSLFCLYKYTIKSFNIQHSTQYSFQYHIMTKYS